MGKSSSSPKTPDYKGAAIATANSSKYDTSSPYGTGAWALRPGADQENPQAGDWTQTTTLSPEQQALYNSNVANRQAAGNALSGMVGDLGDRSSIADALYKRSTQYLDQNFGDQEAALATQLQNKGLTEGSEAYDHALRNFRQTKGQTYEQAASNAVINADTAQNNAVTRIAQLLGATKETNPTAAATGGGADFSSALSGTYNAALGQANAENAANNQTTGTAVTAAMMAAAYYY